MKHARKYAKMFLNAVEGTEEKALQELAVLCAMKEKSSDLSSVLVNPVFTREDKDKALKAVCSTAGIADTTQKFVRFLSDEGAVSGIDEVLDSAVAMYRERKNKVRATVFASVEIGDAEAKRIKDALAKVTGKEVEIETGIDASLIGGLLVKVGSRMFDASIQGQLRLLKEELIKG